MTPGGASGLEHIPERNRIIDDAASAAGRDPAAIRRFANIDERDPAQWQESAKELTAMALDLGVSGFLLASDDAEAIPASLVDRAVEPGDVAYGAKQNNYIRGGSPGPRAAAVQRGGSSRGARVGPFAGCSRKSSARGAFRRARVLRQVDQ